VNDINLILSSAFSDFRAGGINAALSENGGTLIAGEGTRLAGDQLTHTGPRDQINNEVDWNFQFEAPNVETTVTLYACSEAVNLNGNNAGDEGNVACISQTIDVVEAQTPPPPAPVPTPVPPPSEVTTAFDYDGDGLADVAVRRPDIFRHFILNSLNSEIQRIDFGRNINDIPVSGDFDGDDITDIAVRRPSTQQWFVLNSSGSDFNSDNGDGIQRVVFGRQAADIPVPADYDGDGITDFAVRRPSTQQWFVLNSSGSNFNSDNGDGIQRVVFGRQAADIPVPADYDGDGIADIAVRRPATQQWFVRNSSGSNFNSDNGDGIQRVVFGRQAADIPVPADYDGDGIADFAVRRPNNFMWFILNSSGSNFNSDNGDGIQRVRFGLRTTDIPIVADYDGDGIADIAVRRPENFMQFILRSSDGEIMRVRFGLRTTDIPLAAPVMTRMQMAEEFGSSIQEAAPTSLVESPFEVDMLTTQEAIELELIEE
jgi:hypothetical protein